MASRLGASTLPRNPYLSLFGGPFHGVARGYAQFSGKTTTQFQHGNYGFTGFYRYR
jgi:hypothetical protein